MTDNKFLAWTAFVLFVLSALLTLFFVLFSSVLSNLIETPEVILLVIGAFSLLAMVLGLLSFKTPQAKVGGIGGLILLLLVLFVTPVTRNTSTASPAPVESAMEQNGQTGIAEIDFIIDTVLAGSPQEQLGLLRFSTLACTHADGLGGPPKCKEDETEGTRIEAFPFLGPEGHHVRKSEMDDWTGVGATSVYAVYRVSEQVYSEEIYPAGEFAIAFLGKEEASLITAQVADGKIVRLDYTFGGPADIDLTKIASEIILGPPK